MHRFLRASSFGLVVASALQLGCTSASTVSLAGPSTELTSRAGVIELRDDRGHRTPVAADSRVRFTLRDGSSTATVRAGSLCRTATGLDVRSPTAGCTDGSPFVRFDQIESVDVESWDRAGTTALVAGAAVVVVGLVVVVAVSLADKDKKKSSSSSSSRSHTSSGSSNGALVAPALRVGDAMAQQAAYEDAVTLPRTSVGPLFGGADRRRTKVQVLLDTDVSASAFAVRDSLATGGRLGVRLWDFFDVSLGVRALAGEGRPTRPVPVLGVGFHGPFPRARWLALAVGGEVGATAAIDFYATARLGVRIAPFTRFWLGLFPIHPTYTGWSGGVGDRWVAASTFEMGYAF